MLIDFARRRVARPVAVLGCALVALALTTGSCSTSSSSGPAGIGPSGGQITMSDGSSIVIPPGALSLQQAVTMVGTARADLPGGGVPGGSSYALAPDGLVFAVPVTVTLAFSASALPAGTQASDLVLLTAPMAATDYAYAMPTTVVDATHISAQTSHFSNVWVAARNTTSGGQRLTTTGVQGGAGGGSEVCFTAKCTSTPPPDICAGRNESCACNHCNASTIPCCGQDVCMKGKCSDGTADTGEGGADGASDGGTDAAQPDADAPDADAPDADAPDADAPDASTLDAGAVDAGPELKPVCQIAGGGGPGEEECCCANLPLGDPDVCNEDGNELPATADPSYMCPAGLDGANTTCCFNPGIIMAGQPVQLASCVCEYGNGTCSSPFKKVANCGAAVVVQ